MPRRGNPRDKIPGTSGVWTSYLGFLVKRPASPLGEGGVNRDSLLYCRQARPGLRGKAGRLAYCRQAVPACWVKAGRLTYCRQADEFRTPALQHSIPPALLQSTAQLLNQLVR